MKLPRDLAGKELCKKLQKFGHDITRQTGSHLRLTTHKSGEHHITIPNHKSLRIGTLSFILKMLQNILTKLKKLLSMNCFSI